MINLEQTFVEVDGSPVWKTRPDNSNADGEKISLKDVCLNAIGNLKVIPIGNGFQFEQLPLADSLKRYDLMKKISDAGSEVDLSSEEKVLIKNKLPDVYSPFLVGQVAHILK